MCIFVFFLHPCVADSTSSLGNPSLTTRWKQQTALIRSAQIFHDIYKRELYGDEYLIDNASFIEWYPANDRYFSIVVANSLWPWKMSKKKNFIDVFAILQISHSKIKIPAKLQFFRVNSNFETTAITPCNFPFHTWLSRSPRISTFLENLKLLQSPTLETSSTTNTMYGDFITNSNEPGDMCPV